jgi:lipid II:glycine glycyltransferase (peptidoglycan interpeptide bridge formation enzyme)
VNAFWELLQKTKERQNFSTHTSDYYRELFTFFHQQGGPIQTEILLAMHEDKAIAGALLLTHAGTCYYLHGGSDYEYRTMMAPYALHWEAIRWCNAHGITRYDFGGSETVKWPGITRFKLSWGGHQVEYPGAFDIPLSKFWYWLYTLR